MTNPDTLLVFDEAVTRAGVEGWIRHLESAGAPTEMYRLGGTLVLSVSDADLIHKAGPELPAPTHQVPKNGDVWLGRKELRPAGTEVSFGPTTIGDGSVAVIAGPCAVESLEQRWPPRPWSPNTARSACGAVFSNRGPHHTLSRACSGTVLTCWPRPGSGPAFPVVTEVVDPEHVKRLAAVVDGLQIGARNMQNFALLTAVGQSGLPVVLDAVSAAPLTKPSPRLSICCWKAMTRWCCASGVSAPFEPSARFTLDLTAVALWKQRTHLPVMVDPRPFRRPARTRRTAVAGRRCRGRRRADHRRSRPAGASAVRR